MVSSIWLSATEMLSFPIGGLPNVTSPSQDGRFAAILAAGRCLLR